MYETHSIARSPGIEGGNHMHARAPWLLSLERTFKGRARGQELLHSCSGVGRGQ